MSRLRLLLLVAAMPLALWLALPVLSDGAPLSSQIEAKKRAIAEKKSKERVLTSTISAYTERIDVLEGDISVLQARQTRIEAELVRRRAELARVQDELRRERIRLVRLRARLAEARAALSDRLVELYKADKPDVVTVILESDGFADLLERAEFMQRVSEQDARIIDHVREAKEEAVAAERHLDALEERQRKVTAVVAQRAAEVATIKERLVGRQQEFQGVRDQKQQALVSTRAGRRELEGHLAALEKEQAAVQARLAGYVPAGPIRQGSGSMVWPVNGSFTSPFGMRWGRLHAGIDIAAPEGTPIVAADSGRVILAAWTGGYGNYTCISHGGALSTCYGHQSRYGTSAGASVSRGQVIGYVGNTGHSFGAHLHFEVRINGSPVDPMGYL
ncbi:MAG TPA: peptidoglycan DD-metalloendopeptidase family protein [Solirubrobacteraceae bacterium]|jgi:murein DD-endopeptidase MepM/ murein hydrolase activator NlpD|nr:peptidoglycan DD-metalloendopeptidase family protein [Solirubrobacteraceae bacterium]